MAFARRIDKNRFILEKNLEKEIGPPIPDFSKKHYKHVPYKKNIITTNLIEIRNIAKWYQRLFGYSRLQTILMTKDKDGNWIEYWPYSLYDSKNLTVEQHLEQLGIQIKSEEEEIKEEIENNIRNFNLVLEKNTCIYR